MANTVFAVGKNRVVQIPDSVVPGRFTFNLDSWGGYQRLQSIITRIGVSKQCSAQLLHTLGDDTYIYTFGQRVGQITISGLAFTATCDSGNQTQLGAEHILSYYEQNNLSEKQIPTKITIGSRKTFKAYLAGVNVDVEDVPSGIWRFNFLFHEIPERRRKRNLKNGDADPAAGAAAGGAAAGGGQAAGSGQVATPGPAQAGHMYVTPTANGVTTANGNGDVLTTNADQFYDDNNRAPINGFTAS